MRSHELSHSVMQTPPEQVYKSDHRSRVWRVTADGQAYVIKQFVYSPWRQLFARWLGMHPAQREWRRHHALIAAGLPVVPIVRRGWQWSCCGGRYWLATKQVGESLQSAVRVGRFKDTASRKRLLEQLAILTKALFQAGYTHRDYKTSNLLLDEQHQLWMIDVGAVRRNTDSKQVARTLAMLDHTLEKDGFTQAERDHLCEHIKTTITNS